jgi:isoquinoline 1-oxidoreductase subunit alpha
LAALPDKTSRDCPRIRDFVPVLHAVTRGQLHVFARLRSRPTLARHDLAMLAFFVCSRDKKQTGRFAMQLNVNGKVVDVDVEPDTPLLWVIREQVGLTGTKYGCGIAQCGACTVHVDGVAVRSCSMPVSSVTPEQKIVTIEGLSPDGSHPVQKAWAELDVPQCGYCQAGMIMATAALLQENPKPSDEDINSGLTNICRCGTYNRIRAAIKLASSRGQTG